MKKYWRIGTIVGFSLIATWLLFVFINKPLFEISMLVRVSKLVNSN